MADIADITLEWQIALAKDGDGSQLARAILDNNAIGPTILREFLAGVVDGSIKLKRRRKLTWEHRAHRNDTKERNVAFLVDCMLAQEGRRRDREQSLTQELCKQFGTTPEAVALYRKHRRR